MTRKTKQIVRAYAAYNELRIKYVSDLPPAVPGFLDPSKASRTIVVNANRSKSDHVFTILHEIAHFILHFERSHRMRLPWYLTRQWKSKRMIRLSQILRRFVSRKLSKETQADTWAFCVLSQIGATDDVQAILTEYPEKTGVFCLCVFSCIYAGIKGRIKRVIRRIFQPFSA
jgi:hypothetical protein